MKVYIFKLTSGEDIIGMVENAVLPNEEYYNIIDPMNIVGARDESGSAGMRLRSTLLLSNEDTLTIAGKHVLSYYKPVTQLAQYYQKAAEYAKRYTKPMIHDQIEVAIKEIEHDFAEEEKEAERLGDIWKRIIGTTLH